MPPREPDMPERDDLPKESARTILFQFVIFPLGIVVIAVGVFLLFGKLASDEQSIPDYLNEIKSGSSHERWQAAYQLSKALKRGEGKKVANLEDQVAALYQGSKHDDPRIRRYLSMVLGSLGDRRWDEDQREDRMLVAISAFRGVAREASKPELEKLTRDPSNRVQAAAKQEMSTRWMMSARSVFR